MFFRSVTIFQIKNDLLQINLENYFKAFSNRQIFLKLASTLQMDNYILWNHTFA